MEIEKVLPTRGQLERQLSQTLQALYREQFGHSLGKITCHLFADKVAVVAEDTVTSVEKILFNNSKPDLAHSIRLAINEAFTIEVEQVVSNILQVEVVETIVDSVLDSGYLGMIIFLVNAPQVRLAKNKRNQSKDLSIVED